MQERNIARRWAKTWKKAAQFWRTYGKAHESLSNKQSLRIQALEQAYDMLHEEFKRQFSNIQVFEKGLKEIAGDNRPSTWCFECKKWTDGKWSMTNHYCTDCNKDLSYSSIDIRYEEIAQKLLTDKE